MSAGDCCGTTVGSVFDKLDITARVADCAACKAGEAALPIEPRVSMGGTKVDHNCP